MESYRRRPKMTNDEIYKIICNSEEIPYDSTDESSDDEIEIPKKVEKKNKNVFLIDIHSDLEAESEISVDINASVHDSFIALMNDDNNISIPIHSPVAPLYNSNSPARNLRTTSSFQSPVANNASLLKPNASSTPTANLQSNRCPTRSRDLPSISFDPKSSAFEKIIWKQDNMQFVSQEVEFKGDSSLPDDIKTLETPYQVWRYLFPERLENIIVEETLRYAGIDERFSFDVLEL